MYLHAYRKKLSALLTRKTLNFNILLNRRFWGDASLNNENKTYTEGPLNVRMEKKQIFYFLIRILLE